MSTQQSSQQPHQQMNTINATETSELAKIQSTVADFIPVD